MLAFVKEYATDYTKRLPDYICTQVTKRNTTFTPPNARPGSFDVIDEQLTFANHGESYQVVAINGKKSPGVSHAQLGGMISFGEFGSLLANTFGPLSRTEFKFDRMAVINGRKAFAFAYEVPQGMGYRLAHQDADESILAAYKGFVYADAETRRILRLTAKCIDLPRTFPMKEVELTVDYKSVPIGGQEYMLPLHSKIHIRDTHSAVNTEIDYTRYRKFSSDSTLVSEPEASKP